MHYRHGFHSRLADLNRLLRYSLGSLLTAHHYAGRTILLSKIFLDSWVVVSTGVINLLRPSEFSRNIFEMFPDITNFAHNDYSSWSPFLFFSADMPWRRHGFKIQNINYMLFILKDSAPLKLPTRYCPSSFLPMMLAST